MKINSLTHTVAAIGVVFVIGLGGLFYSQATLGSNNVLDARNWIPMMTYKGL